MSYNVIIIMRSQSIIHTIKLVRNQFFFAKKINILILNEYLYN